MHFALQLMWILELTLKDVEATDEWPLSVSNCVLSCPCDCGLPRLWNLWQSLHHVLFVESEKDIFFQMTENTEILVASKNIWLRDRGKFMFFCWPVVSHHGILKERVEEKVLQNVWLEFSPQLDPGALQGSRLDPLEHAKTKGIFFQWSGNNQVYKTRLDWLLLHQSSEVILHFLPPKMDEQIQGQRELKQRS